MKLLGILLGGLALFLMGNSLAARLKDKRAARDAQKERCRADKTKKTDGTSIETHIHSPCEVIF